MLGTGNDAIVDVKFFTFEKITHKIVTKFSKQTFMNIEQSP